MARRAMKLAALAGLAKQAREYARKNPDTVSSKIEQVESAVSRRVGPKYAQHVGKGGNAVRSGLGIGSGQTRPGTTPPVPPVPPVPPATPTDGRPLPPPPPT